MPKHRFQTVAEYLSAQPQPLCDIGLVVAGIVDDGLPGAEAGLWGGHPTWRAGKQPLASVKAFTRHVTLVLEDGGPPLKLRELDDVDPDGLAERLAALHAGRAGAPAQ